MNSLTSILAMLFLGTMCILWPFWLTDGYLTDWYLKIVTFIAAYGGFIANLIYYIQNRKKH